MTTRQCLADSYLASGQAKEAVSVYKRVVADRERALGPDHLDTIRARYRLGAAYQATGKTVAAERSTSRPESASSGSLGPATRMRCAAARSWPGCTTSWAGTRRRALLRDTVEPRRTASCPGGDPQVAELRAILADIGDE